MNIIFVDKPRLIVGRHVPYEQTSLSSSLEAFSILGMDTVQLFMGSPLTAKRSPPSLKEIERSKYIVDRNRMTVFSHLPYVLSLSGSKKLNILSTDPKFPREVSSSIQHETDVIGRISKNGGCVIHPGSWKDRNKGLEAISSFINSEINFTPESCKLLLENSDGSGDKLCKNFQELRYIYDNVQNKENIGFCIDTCHLFAAGEETFDSPERMLNEFYKWFSFYPSLIHLNDSKQSFGSKRDVHADIFHGKIWGAAEKQDNFREFINLCGKREIPLIMETPVEIEDCVNHNTIRELYISTT